VTGTGSRVADSTGSRPGEALRTITAITAATPSAAMRSAWPKVSGLTAAVVSTGPPRDASAGSTSCSRPRACGPVAATTRPASEQASAASTPAPPPLDTIATEVPPGTGWDDISTATSSSSPKLSVAMMPACSNSACRVISGAAAAAVCEAAARWPGADRPAWTVSTGN
jgi:hypothetical protein